MFATAASVRFLVHDIETVPETELEWDPAKATPTKDLAQLMGLPGKLGIAQAIDRERVLAAEAL